MKDSTSKNLQTKIFELFDQKEVNLDLDTLKKKHRKAYLKQKHQEYKLKWKKETLRFTHQEFAELTEISEQYELKRAPFLKACIFAYIRDTFITPDDTQIKIIESKINQIAQSINKSVRYIHLNQNISLADLEDIKQQLHQLEVTLSETFNNPPNLKSWVLDQVNNDDRFILKLKKTLKELNHDCKDP